MTDNAPSPPDLEPLSRTQILGVMGLTAVVLLLVAKAWQYLGSVSQLALDWNLEALLWGGGVGLGITGASGLVYRLWPAYRKSADVYLKFVLEPLVWPDLVWLGLLPGMSEELLFRGVMLPSFGLNPIGLCLSSFCFGVLHLTGKEQWPYTIWATIIGAVFGASALFTHNLLVPIVAHITTNFVSACLWKLEHPMEE